MKYLLIIALISCTGTLVYSQSNKTSCDPGISNNVTCFQGGCSPQPCATLCGDAAAYDECVQSCTGGGCDKLACSSSIIWTAHNHAPGVNVIRCIAIPSDANKVAPEVSAIWPARQTLKNAARVALGEIVKWSVLLVLSNAIRFVPLETALSSVMQTNAS